MAIQEVNDLFCKVVQRREELLETLDFEPFDFEDKTCGGLSEEEAYKLKSEINKLFLLTRAIYVIKEAM